MNNGSKNRKQSSSNHLYSNTNGDNNNNSNNHHVPTPTNSIRSQQLPFHIRQILRFDCCIDTLITKIRSKQQYNNNNQNQYIRYGCTIIVVSIIYLIITSIQMMNHHQSITVTNNSMFTQQSTTPLQLTNSEQDIISRILGIKKSIIRKDHCTKQKQKYKIQVPPTTLRKGKSQYISDIDYQNQAVQLVHNIRVVLGTATQLGYRQQQQRKLKKKKKINIENDSELSSSSSTDISLTTNTTTTTTVSSSFKSFDNAVIMDYGCGSGRLLIGLLSANICFQKYIGVDVNPKDIQWLTDTYIHNNNIYSNYIKAGTQRLKRNKQKLKIIDNNNNNNNNDDTNGQERIDFIHVNVKNERYNKNGQVLNTDSIDMNERYIFTPVINDVLKHTIDIMILRSVFTHMLSDDIYHHLHALYPLLKPKTGIMVVSIFLNTIPNSPVETVMSKEEQERGMHLVYISKTVFENIIYETGYQILLYMSQWNIGEDLYILSNDGKIQPNDDTIEQDEEQESNE